VGGKLERLGPEDRPPEWRWLLANRSRLWAGVRQMLRLVGHRYPVGSWWRLNRAILDAIREDCRAAGARALFVYLHTKSHRPFPALAGYMRETSADFIDLGNPPLDPTRLLNYPDDGHPNPAGHRFTADAILEWVAREMPELLEPALAGRVASPAPRRLVRVGDRGDAGAGQQREVADVLEAHHAGADDPVAERVAHPVSREAGKPG
jgi:hypothetical protein